MRIIIKNLNVNFYKYQIHEILRNDYLGGVQTHIVTILSVTVNGLAINLTRRRPIVDFLSISVIGKGYS